VTWTFAQDYTLVRDQIRVMIGDVLTTDQLLDDAAIAFFYLRAGNDLLGGALLAAKAAAAKLALECDVTASKASSKRSQRHIAMLNVIAALEDEQAREKATYTMPEVGQVADSEHYPKEFASTNLAAPTWEADE
jgi:hypothetical protein